VARRARQGGGFGSALRANAEHTASCPRGHRIRGAVRRRRKSCWLGARWERPCVRSARDAAPAVAVARRRGAAVRRVAPAEERGGIGAAGNDRHHVPLPPRGGPAARRGGSDRGAIDGGNDPRGLRGSSPYQLRPRAAVRRVALAAEHSGYDAAAGNAAPPLPPHAAARRRS
jgi:hypothetical protein